MSTYTLPIRTSVQHMGNNNPRRKEVHDLNNEKPSCRISEILKAKHAVAFIPDTLDEAHRSGYHNCAHCLGNP